VKSPGEDQRGFEREYSECCGGKKRCRRRKINIISLLSSRGPRRTQAKKKLPKKKTLRGTEKEVRLLGETLDKYIRDGYLRRKIGRERKLREPTKEGGRGLLKQAGGVKVFPLGAGGALRELIQKVRP